MPLNPDASPPPRKDRGELLELRQAIEPAAPSIRCVSLGTSRIYITYGLPVALVACVIGVALARTRAEFGDVASGLGIGVTFWFAGYLVQVVSHLAVWGVWNQPCESVTVGLLGVEFPPVHQRPRHLVILAVATVIPLVLAAIASTMIGVGWAGEAFWVTQKPIAIPSLGNSATDRVWQSGGLLLIIQMLCQFFPLPRTPGRQVLLGVAAAALRHLDLKPIVLVAQRMIVLVAVLVAMVALAIMPLEVGDSIQRWPVLMIIAVMLWVTSRSDDIEVSLWSLVNAESARLGPAPRIASRPGSWTKRQMQTVRSLAGRRRLRQAMAREHGEAVDAAKLDEILAKLHSEGEKSLTPNERAVLRRVSETLRKRDKLVDPP